MEIEPITFGAARRKSVGSIFRACPIRTRRKQRNPPCSAFCPAAPPPPGPPATFASPGRRFMTLKYSLCRGREGRGAGEGPGGGVKIRKEGRTLDQMPSIAYNLVMTKQRSKNLTDQIRQAIDDSGLTRYRIAQDTGIPRRPQLHATARGLMGTDFKSVPVQTPSDFKSVPVYTGRPWKRPTRTSAS